MQQHAEAFMISVKSIVRDTQLLNAIVKATNVQAVIKTLDLRLKLSLKIHSNARSGYS